MIGLINSINPSVHPDVRKLVQDVDTLLESAPGSTNKASYSLIRKRVEARLHQIDQEIAQLNNELDERFANMQIAAYRIAIRERVEKMKRLEQKAK